MAERFQVPLEEVAAALAAGSRAPHRMALAEALSGARVIDDTYNASPVSTLAALEFLAETPLPPGRRRLAVLGDMLELGPDEEELHRQVGERAGRIVDGLVTVGERARLIAEGARAAGLARVASAADLHQAEAIVDRVLDPGVGDLLLVKGSRGVELDRLVATLTGVSKADRETG
ncbi:MAG: hypothetical protein E6J47_02215 [Chloroflexi bacterium]|nr:MAG: hypothetical protein E6J47_02215 [Chloroflexota bacterium]